MYGQLYPSTTPRSYLCSCGQAICAFIIPSLSYLITKQLLALKKEVFNASERQDGEDIQISNDQTSANGFLIFIAVHFIAVYDWCQITEQIHMRRKEQYLVT